MVMVRVVSVWLSIFTTLNKVSFNLVVLWLVIDRAFRTPSVSLLLMQFLPFILNIFIADILLCMLESVVALVNVHIRRV